MTEKSAVTPSARSVQIKMTDDFHCRSAFDNSGFQESGLYLIDAGAGIGAWYVQKGGNVELKAGTKIEVEALR